VPGAIFSLEKNTTKNRKKVVDKQEKRLEFLARGCLATSCSKHGLVFLGHEGKNSFRLI
jgi:hypothetical protein